MSSTFGAFVGECRLTSPLATANAGSRVLVGATFAVKDMIDVQGFVTGCGCRAFVKNHDQQATRHATVVEMLLNAGASVVGKTVCDELAFSCRGVNDWLGAPENPNAPSRIAGGSSSGSAVAVAAGLCEFALGTDTGCSVRLPAGFCGVYGIRPTHGRIAMDGVKPLASSFDTVGWFARSASMLQRVGSVLLVRPPTPNRSISKFVIARDAFALMEPDAANALLKVARRFATDEVDMFQCAPASEWLRTYLVVAGREIWLTHRKWIEEKQPQFGASIERGFKNVAALTDENFATYSQLRATLIDVMRDFLAVDTAIIAPVSSSIALRLDSTEAEFAKFTNDVLTLGALASVARLPQLVVPAVTLHGCPIGLSFIGAAGADESLLALATQFEQEQQRDTDS